MVLHKHVDGEDTMLVNMTGPLINYHLGKWIGVIIRGSYQEAAEDPRWEYEPVFDFYPYMDPDSDCIVDGSSHDGKNYQENLDGQEQ